jgi:hypothetical protein
MCSLEKVLSISFQMLNWLEFLLFYIQTIIQLLSLRLDLSLVFSLIRLKLVLHVVIMRF